MSGDLEIDFAAHGVHLQGQAVRLTPTKYRLVVDWGVFHLVPQKEAFPNTGVVWKVTRTDWMESRRTQEKTKGKTVANDREYWAGAVGTRTQRRIRAVAANRFALPGVRRR